MIIAFDSTQLRELCEDPSAADAYLGGDRAAILRDRLADIRAAATYRDLIVGDPRTGGESGRDLRISIGPEAALLLTANHLRLPRNDRGEVDWNRVSYVRVVKVELL
jgi:hypothetical protein